MTPEKRTKLYMTAAHLGAFGTAFMIVARSLDWSDFFQGVPMGILLASIGLLFIRKMRDEYLETLWSSGVSLAFIAVVVWFLFGPFLAEAMSGNLAGIRPAESSTSWSGIIALAAFFTGFHIRWLRGAL